MSKLLKQAKASLKLLEASRIGPERFRTAKQRAKKRLMEVPNRIGFATREEVDELRQRIETLEARLAARPTETLS